MADILNLDELKTSKEFVLGGKRRTIRSMTVEEFINASDFDKKFAEAGPTEQVSMLVDLVVEFVKPDTKREELVKLSLKQLTALLNYARAMDDEGNGPAAAAK